MGERRNMDGGKSDENALKLEVNIRSNGYIGLICHEIVT